MDTRFKKIAACPFCKSANTLVVVDMGDYWGKCRDCGATGPTRHNHDEAAEIWNGSEAARPLIHPDETVREAMLAHRLAKWLEQLKSGYRDRMTESVRRHIESLLNEQNPVLAELEEAIGEAFDAFKVQTQDEDGGSLDEPEYSVPNAKRAFDALAALAKAITRPKEQDQEEAERLAASGSVWYLVQYDDGIEYVYDAPPQAGNPKVKSFRKINGIELSTRYNRLSDGRDKGTNAAPL